MADQSVEASRKGIMESGQSEDLGWQGSASSSSSYRSTTFNRRRSTSNHGSSWNIFNTLKYSHLILIVVVLCLFGFYHFHLSDELSVHGWFSSPSLFYGGNGEGRSIMHTGHAEARSMLSDPPNPNCTKVYTAVAGETCASLRSSHGLTQPQIFELNPTLNCKTLTKGQSICVAGISAHCGATISVTKGEKNPTCASIEAARHISTEGFAILNPGISCPEAAGNNNAWPSSHLVCVFPGLGNIFFEYLGASGLPITFDDVSPLVQEFSSVSYHVILAFAIDVDATGTHTNGTFYPYWSSELTPTAATAFKAANPGVQILISLGGASKFVNSNKTVSVTWVEPANTGEWIANAESSITALANEYSIDGIDIDYESFPNGSSNFAYCIGTLIEKLKAANTIGLATIAPFGAVLSEYQNLTNLYGDQVDYINFQFYAYQLHTVSSYIAEFNTIAYLFPPWKLMASTQTNGSNSISGTSFVSAVEQIQQSRGLPGVMLYDADHSVPSNFTDEKEILSVLNARGSSTTPPPAPPVGLAPGSGPAPSPSSGAGGAPKSSLAPAPASKSSIAPGAPTSISGGGAPKSSLAPAPASKSGLAPGPTPTSGGAPKSSLAPAPASKSGLAPGPTPTSGGTPKSSLAPAPASKSGLAPGPAPTSGGSPKSSLGPTPHAPKSGPAESPGSGHGGAPKSSLGPTPHAPKSGPAESPGSGHGGAPKSSLAPGTGPGSGSGTSPAPGSPSTPGSGGAGENGTAPAPGPPSSAPGSLLSGRWAFQGLGLVTTVIVLLFSL